jgi:hypothetical protein
VSTPICHHRHVELGAQLAPRQRSAWPHTVQTAHVPQERALETNHAPPIAQVARELDRARLRDSAPRAGPVSSSAMSPHGRAASFAEYTSILDPAAPDHVEGLGPQLAQAGTTPGSQRVDLVDRKRAQRAHDLTVDGGGRRAGRSGSRVVQPRIASGTGPRPARQVDLVPARQLPGVVKLWRL